MTRDLADLEHLDIGLDQFFCVIPTVLKSTRSVQISWHCEANEVTIVSGLTIVTSIWRRGGDVDLFYIEQSYIYLCNIHGNRATGPVLYQVDPNMFAINRKIGARGRSNFLMNRRPWSYIFRAIYDYRYDYRYDCLYKECQH